MTTILDSTTYKFNDYCGLDLETDGLDPKVNNIVTIAIQSDSGSYLWKTWAHDKQFFVNLFTELAKYKVVLHNAKFDLSFILEKYNVELPKVVDTFICSRIISNGKLEGNSLPDCLERYLGVVDDAHKDKKSIRLSFKVGTLTKAQLEYATSDIVYLPELGKVMEKACEPYDKVYKLEHELLPVIIKMEARGVRIDEKKLTTLISEWSAKNTQCLAILDREVDKLYDKFGVIKPFFNNTNYSSPEQLINLFKIFGQPVPSDGEKDTTGEDTLLEYINERPNSPMKGFIKALLDFREYHKLVSTYGQPLLDRVVNGYLHGEFKQLGTDTGRLSSANPNCFDGDTEVLTKQGWMKFKDAVITKPEIAQYHLDKTISFTAPTDWYTFKNQELIHIRTRGISLCVTKDHRCLLQSRKTGQFIEKRADDFKNDYKQIHSGVWEGGGGLPLSDKEIQLIVAIQADGNVTKHGRIDFSFFKKRKYDRLLRIVGGMDYKICKCKDPLRMRMYVNRPDLCKFKEFGDWVFDMNRHQIDIFLNEVFYWDGLSTRRNNYASAVEKNTDLLQALFVLSGKRARKRLYISKGGSRSHQLDIVNTDYSLTTNFTKTDVGVQEVFCCSVPSSYIVVRRDGCVMVTGQCQNFPSDGDGGVIRECFLADEGHLMITSDMHMAEIRIAADYSKDRLLLKAVKEGDDMHSKLASVSFSIIFGEPVEVSKSTEPIVIKGVTFTPDELRTVHKSATFCKFYKGGPKRIYGVLSKYINMFHQKGGMKIAYKVSEALDNEMKGLSYYLLDVISEANRRGYLIGKYGRIRYFRPNAFGSAANYKIQNANGEAIKMAMVRVDKYLTENNLGRIVLSVHDELACSVRADKAEEAAVVIKQIMADSLEFFLDEVEGGASVTIAKHWKK